MQLRSEVVLCRPSDIFPVIGRWHILDGTNCHSIVSSGWNHERTIAVPHYMDHNSVVGEPSLQTVSFLWYNVIAYLKDTRPRGSNSGVGEPSLQTASFLFRDTIVIPFFLKSKNELCEVCDFKGSFERA